jgi:hypothetical protein
VVEEIRMESGEAVVMAVSESGAGQEVELQAVCPRPNLERLDVVVGLIRVRVPLGRPARGAQHRFKVQLRAGAPFRPGDKAFVEFYYPGEQARSHCTGAGHPPE